METYCVEVTVNLMTYFPCKAAGTQCNRPRELSFFNKRSVKVFSPRRRKTTMPRCRAAGISKRASAKTKASNFCANLTPYVNAYPRFTLHCICVERTKVTVIRSVRRVFKTLPVKCNFNQCHKRSFHVYLSYVLLQAGNSIIPDNEPQFQGSKSFRQRNLPVLEF